MKKRPKILGEIFAIMILIVILVWFFLINYNPKEITINSIITGIILVLTLIWSVISILRYIRV